MTEVITGDPIPESTLNDGYNRVFIQHRKNIFWNPLCWQYLMNPDDERRVDFPGTKLNDHTHPRDYLIIQVKGNPVGKGTAYRQWQQHIDKQGDPFQLK